MITLKTLLSKASDCGLALALIPCICAVTFLSSGCIDAYGVVELKADRDDHNAAIRVITSDIALAEKRVDDLGDRADEPKSVQAGLEKIVTERRKAQGAIEELEQKLRNETTVLDACQKSFRVTITLKPGEKFESVVLKGGRTLKNAVYKSFSDEKIKFSHSGGVGTYSVAEMPESIAKYVLIRPSAPLSEVSYQRIFDKKPDILKSNAQIRGDANRDQKAKYDASRTARLNERKAREKKSEDDSRKRDDEHALVLKKEKDERIRKDGLNAEIKHYEQGLRSLKFSFSEQERAWDTSKVKKSQSDRQSIIDDYQRKLRAVEEKISALRKKISAQ